MTDFEHEPFPVMTAEEFNALAALPAVAEARFTCARHGTAAGVVRLLGGYGGGWMVAVDSFVCRHFQRIHERPAEALRDHIRRADAREIHVMDVAWAPFYCVHCDAAYCGECWKTTEVAHPEWPHCGVQVRGVCPAGHERMLAD